MICKKCNTQFKAKIPLTQSRQMIGLCDKCGRRLTYHEIPEAFSAGLLFSVMCSPLLFMVLFEKTILISTAFLFVAMAALVRWLVARLGGYSTFESIEEYEKGNLALKIGSFFAGCVFSFGWFITYLQLIE